MGNPSDGFYGKTIALSVANFWADVTIVESAKLVGQVFSMHYKFTLLYCNLL